MTAGRSKKTCSFTEAGVNYIDYKNIDLLKRFVSKYGKVVPRYYSGVSLQMQKQLARAIKRAREMGMLPFVK